MTKIDAIFKEAVTRGASDIHFVVGRRPIFRIDGQLTEYEKHDVMDDKTTAEMIFSLMSERQKGVYLNEREMDLGHEINGTSRFRINCHWERNHPGLVARIIPQDIPTMESLLMPNIVYELLRMKQGLILVTGPTGCGKSTSLAAMISMIAHERAEHIVTLEDPIEFIYEHDPGIKAIIKQRQLGNDMLSFAAALKHVLRQDPNVILVGEMRDLDTIAATITLAETGHLVLATLHTFNAGQTVDRIIDVFPPYQQSQVRLQLSLFLKGIISQQLLQKKGGGRIAAREILVNTPAISNLIRENKIAQIKTTIQTSAEEGMFTMDQDLKRLYDQGVIEKETARMYMSTPTSMDR